MLATDHAPHTLEEKARPYAAGAVRPAAGAVRAAMRAGTACYEGQLTHGAGRAEVRACAGAVVRRARARLPARRLLGRPGARSTTRRMTVRREDVLSKCGWSPFEGTTFHSSIAATWVNGVLVWNGTAAGRSPQGQRSGIRAVTARRGCCACWLAAGACGASDRMHTDVPDCVAARRAGRRHTARGNQVLLGERDLNVGADGAFAFGVGRDEAGPLKLTRALVRRRNRNGANDRVTHARLAGRTHRRRAAGDRRPAARDRRAHRARTGARRAPYAARRRARRLRTGFHWPVQGRISGRFGNQRVYVFDGTAVPKSPHSGMDIAAPTGYAGQGASRGRRHLRRADLYLTGGTVLLDHGHGVSSNFLHLSRIDVKVGDRVEQGQAIGAVGDDRARDRPASALGDELVRRAGRSAVGAGNFRREVTPSHCGSAAVAT